MAGYIELQVTKQDRKNCNALHAVAKFILDHVDRADLVASVSDKVLSADTAWTVVVPDEQQFDRLLDAFRALSTTEDRPLLSLTCYRNGRPSELAPADGELSIEYFNPRPDSDGFMIRHTDSAVRLTHRSTGIVVISEGGRSRHANLQVARQMLSAKLTDSPSALLLGDQAVKGLKHCSLSTPTR